MSNWFIALPVTAAVLPMDARTALPCGTRALHRDDLHITLAFLGAVGDKRAAQAWQCIEHLSREAIDTHVAGRAALGPPGRPSALALDLEGAASDGELTRFIGHWRGILCAAAGVEVDRRPLRPHVTLGRPPRRRDRAWHDSLRTWLARPTPAAALRLDAVALYTRAGAGSDRRFQCTACRRWCNRGPSGEKQQ